jgi:hypothetical protein
VPRVSAWFVRASLCHLVFGFTVGALLLADKGVPFAPELWALRPAHVEVLLIGWMVQLVMGVAIWIFPRFALRRTPQRSAATAWLAFALLNAGVVCVAVGGGWGGWAAVGRLGEIGAAASFVAHLWGRVSPAGLSEI